MSSPYVGEIRLVGFNFAPVGWSVCNGATIAISENETLFNLIGTTYGGNGVTTFVLPDLRGRSAMHFGLDSQGNNYQQGQTGGVESVTLTTQQIPSHSHTLAVSSSLGTSGSPKGNYLAVAPLALGNVSSDSGTLTNMGAQALQISGGSQPHDNRQQSLVLNYIIALYGVYPSQN